MPEINILERESHNVWNIIWLPIIFILNIYLLNNWNDFSEFIFIVVFHTYLMLDYFWILQYPDCVNSPKVILLHHFASIMGVNILPYLDNELKHFICMATLVEINTWIRIMKIYVKDYKLVLDIIFIISWIGFRLIMGPMIQYMIYRRTLFDPTFMNSMLLIISTILNSMSLVWSYQIIKKFISNDK